MKASASSSGLSPIRLCAHIVVCAASLATWGCANRVMLDERFHDTRLINWTVVDDPDTLEGASDWRVEGDGWLHQRGNIWGRRGDFIGRWFGTFVVAGDAGWKDYTLTVKAKPTDDDGFGVVFRYQDSEHFYRLLFLQDGLSGGPITRLDRREGADYTELWSAERGYRPDVELTIEVKVDGEVIRASVDGKQLFEAKDASYRTARSVCSVCAEGQAFDDVRVVSD
jgi:hypothetical protein